MDLVDNEGCVCIYIFADRKDRDAAIGDVELLEDGAGEYDWLVGPLKGDIAASEDSADLLAVGREIYLGQDV